MTQYSNVSAVPLSLAVFLATDEYEYSKDTISATTLIKPLRQIILASRVPVSDAQVDLINLMPSRMGTAIHNQIERAWKTNYKNAMISLGYPQRVIERVRINPTEEELTNNPEIIPIYMECRTNKQIGRHIISGKFDFVMNGRVEDFKSTSTFTAVNSTNDEKYILQGSIYRWLNPKIITSDQIAIQYIFTDWSKARALQDQNYPQARTKEHVLPLRSIAETEAFITRKLELIEKYWSVPEDEIPECTDEDLWRTEPTFKYYKNPEKTARSTKNFDNKQDAYIRLAEDGNVGVVKEQPGQVTACKYCNGYSVCSQKDTLIAKGELIL